MCIYSPHTASEYRAWMLFYSLPVLKGILPAAQYEHFALLVCCMHILLSERISAHSLDAAQSMLDQFYWQFEQLYGEQIIIHSGWRMCYTLHVIGILQVFTTAQ